VDSATTTSNQADIHTLIRSVRSCGWNRRSRHGCTGNPDARTFKECPAVVLVHGVG
jgi:hypothetical protein